MILSYIMIFKIYKPNILIKVQILFQENKFRLLIRHFVISARCDLACEQAFISNYVISGNTSRRLARSEQLTARLTANMTIT
jgi:hypothetical protein